MLNVMLTLFFLLGALAWGSDFLSSGSRDRNILNRDPRVPGDIVRRLSGHKQEVRGFFAATFNKIF